MPPFRVNLSVASSLEASPQKTIIIVSKYELVEKCPGVFG